jgi:Domain of unknown function (DUF4276)
MIKGYILVEGHGEVAAAGNLVARLWQRTGHALPWGAPLRWKNLHLRRGLEQGANFIRAQSDAGALLVLRDEDDACPRRAAPEMAAWLSALRLPFPTALVLFHPEYEVLFLPCVARMAGQPIVQGSGPGRPGLLEGSIYEGDWEAHRGVKEWLSRHFPRGLSYKPVQDQLPMTRMLDLDVVRAAGVPCFATLERALGFLATAIDAGIGGVYPPSGG